MKFILIIFLSVHCLALASNETELHILDELEPITQKRIEKIISAREDSQERRFTKSELFTLKVTLKDITKSKLETVFIRKGSKLIRLSDGETLYTPKRLTVKAHAKIDKDGYRYVTDKTGIPKYMASIDYMTNVSEITDLYRDPKKFKRLEKKLPKIKFDEELNYQIIFNFHAGLSLTQFTKSIIKDAQDYAPFIRLEIGSNTNFNLPIDTGLSLVYEQVSGNLDNNAGSFSTRALSLGPNFIKENLIGDYDFLIQTRIAIVSDLTERRSGEIIDHRLSDTSLLLGLEKNFTLKNIGKFKLGYTMQRKWLKPKAKTTGLDLSINAKADDSFGIFIGHGTDLIW